MKSWKSGSRVVIASVGVIALAALAKEHEVKASEVPAAVMKVISTRYPNARPSKFVLEEKKGKVAYEAQFEVEGHRTELLVSPEGTLVAEEQVIDSRDLPAPVKSTFSASDHAKAKLLRVEKEIRDGITNYEILVEEHGKKKEVVIDASGKLVKVKEKGKGGHEAEDAD